MELDQPLSKPGEDGIIFQSGASQRRLFHFETERALDLGSEFVEVTIIIVQI